MALANPSGRRVPLFTLLETNTVVHQEMDGNPI